MATFKKQQVTIRSAFRLVEKKVFEQRFPGRIEKEGLQVQSKMVEGVMREVVRVRKLPDGEWDCDVEEVAGVEQTEQQTSADDLHLRASQHAHVYNSFASAVSAPSDGAAYMHEDDAYVPEGEPGEAKAESQSEGDSDEGDHMNMDSLLPSLLHDVDFRPKAKDAVKSSAPSSKTAAFVTPSKSARSSASAASSTRAPASSAKVGAPSSSVKSRPKASPPPSDDESAAALAQSIKKFKGKSAEDILNPHGYQKLFESLDTLGQKLLTSPFTDTLEGDQLQLFKDKVTELKKEASGIQRLVVNLDLKVKKWQVVPEEVSACMMRLRSRSKVSHREATSVSPAQPSISSYQSVLGHQGPDFRFLESRTHRRQ